MQYIEEGIRDNAPTGVMLWKAKDMQEKLMLVSK
jgi:hypothetical protein